VNITNVADLYIWNIKLLFDPSVLVCTGVVEVADSIFGSRDSIGLSVKINNTGGYVVAWDGLWSDLRGVNGSGTLCQIQFNVLQPAISSICFADVGKYGGTILFDSAQPPKPIPSTQVNGFVQVNARGFQSSVFQALKGGIPYDVTIFSNSTVSGFTYDDPSCTILMRTSSENSSSETIAVLAIRVPNDLMNSSYFTILVNGQVTNFRIFGDLTSHFITTTYHQSGSALRVFPTVGGDLNGDRRVDMKDIAIVAYSFGSTPETPRWNPITDINFDLKTDMKDIAFVAKYFGEIY
jgi:hypothetical protein